MNEITKAPVPMVYADLERLAASVAQSGLFGIKTKDQAIALMMIAHAEGRHPALAARDYDVIQGKPAKKAEAMMRDFIEAGGKVEWHALTDTLADATFTHPQTGSVRIDWDIKRATVAGFAGKDNWKKFPRAMLRSRVVSEGVRTVWPLATSGMYVPEEQADIERHNGPTLEADAEDEAPVAPLRAVAAETKKPERKVDPTVYEAPPEPAPEKRTWAQWKDALEIAVKAAQTPEERGRLIAQAEVVEIVRLARLGPYHPTKARIIELYEEVENRYLADPPDPPEEPDLSDEALGEVQVEGEKYVTAG